MHRSQAGIRRLDGGSTQAAITGTVGMTVARERCGEIIRRHHAKRAIRHLRAPYAGERYQPHYQVPGRSGTPPADSTLRAACTAHPRTPATGYPSQRPSALPRPARAAIAHAAPLASAHPASRTVNSFHCRATRRATKAGVPAHPPAGTSSAPQIRTMCTNPLSFRLGGRSCGLTRA
jgi:hypothetical protein